MALPAFMSSSYGTRFSSNKLLLETIQTTDYKELTDGEQLWKERVNIAVQPKNYSLQADWDLPICSKQYNNLLSQQTELSEKARLMAVASEHSTDWLHAIPIPSLGLKLDNSSIRSVCGLRLGATLCQEHTCVCGVEVTGKED